MFNICSICCCSVQLSLFMYNCSNSHKSLVISVAIFIGLSEVFLTQENYSIALPVLACATYFCFVCFCWSVGVFIACLEMCIVEVSVVVFMCSRVT